VDELEDFEKAKRLFEAQKENTVTKMNENERRIIQYIAVKGNAQIMTYQATQALNIKA
jgi:predicted RNA-binding protein Jag